MGLTGGAALKKGGKSARICDSSASSCCYPANLITTPLCALVGCKESQQGGGGWGLLPTALPLSVPAITSCLSITWQAGGDGG